MQYLKDYIREKILMTAEEAFFEEGYTAASLRGIATHSGVTVGNLYRYFENKEALLDAVLRPLLIEVEQILDDLLNENTLDDRKLHQEFHLRVAERLSLITQKHYRLISIMISGVLGTKYAHYFQEIIHRVAVGMQEVITKGKPFIQLQPIIYEVLARNHVEGILYIITHLPDPTEQQVAILQFLNVHLHYFESVKEEV